MTDLGFSESLSRLKESFLYAAANGGNIDDCNQLIEIGADVNWKNSDGDTPLLAACRKGYADTVSFLLANGADPNCVGNDGFAPIHIASRRGDADTLCLLLDAAAIPSKKNKEGQTALDIAKSKGYDEIYSRLMSHRRGVPTNHVSNTINDNLLSTTRKRNLPSIPNISPRIQQQYENASTVNISTATNVNTISKKNNIIHSRLLSAIQNDNDEYDDNNDNNDNVINSDAYNEIVNIENSNNNSNKASIAVSNKQNVYNSGYTIMNPHNQKEKDLDETSIALQKILELEMKDRRASDEKCALLMEQNNEFSNEILILKNELLTLNERFSKLSDFNDRLMCKPSVIETMNMIQLEDLEKQLKISLEAVELRKASIIREELGKQKEERLCVICQEKEKSVVLLPCRHMCLCDSCSIHEQLNQCPLCRRPIAHKISVYA